MSSLNLLFGFPRDSPEGKFFSAFRKRDEANICAVLSANPEMDVNTWDPNDLNRMRPIHIAVSHGYLKLTRMLLARPDLDVNAHSMGGKTAMFYGNQCLEALELLLADPRVDLTVPDKSGLTPFMSAIVGRKDAAVLEAYVASGKPLGMLSRPSTAGSPEISVLAYAQRSVNEWMETPHTPAYGKAVAVLKVITELTERPDELRRRLRNQRAIPKATALFATTVFLCDGLLNRRAEDENSGTGRYFRITEALPMELQMVLAHRVYGSAKNFVSSSEAEAEFRRLARVYV